MTNLCTPKTIHIPSLLRSNLRVLCLHKGVFVIPLNENMFAMAECVCVHTRLGRVMHTSGARDLCISTKHLYYKRNVGLKVFYVHSVCLFPTFQRTEPISCYIAGSTTVLRVYVCVVRYFRSKRHFVQLPIITSFCN